MTQTRPNVKTSSSGSSARPSALDRYFGITEHGSTIPRELRAGLTTWLTMSYIIFVNP